MILTGAGFSKDVGGYSAQEMWARIFNTLSGRSKKRLCSFMKNYDSKDISNTLDFETIYDLVMQGRHSETMLDADQIKGDQDAFLKALSDVYEIMDDRIRACGISRGGVDLKKLEDFLCTLFRTETVRGFLFTLNQDLFVERWLSARQTSPTDGLSLYLPGMDDHPLDMQGEGLTDKGFLTLPKEETIQTYSRERDTKPSAQGQLQYIKLHGSWNWRRDDRNSAMAIGHMKSAVLKDEPLFKWYYDTFEAALSKNSQRLLVIGYGFRDRHINEVILKSIDNSNLQLFVVDPRAPEDFRAMLMTSHAGGVSYPYSVSGMRIWSKGLAGYVQATLSQVFPKDSFGDENTLAMQIREMVSQ
ncbi:MAG: SIR2 family protein [Nitrospira sp.]